MPLNKEIKPNHLKVYDSCQIYLTQNRENSSKISERSTTSQILIISRIIEGEGAKNLEAILFLVYFFKFLDFKHRANVEYEVHTISFQTFFELALFLIVHTWNSSPIRSRLLQLQCTCCTVPITSGRPHGTLLVWACQWPSSQPLSSPRLSHNDSLWA